MAPKGPFVCVINFARVDEGGGGRGEGVHINFAKVDGGGGGKGETSTLPGLMVEVNKGGKWGRNS